MRWTRVIAVGVVACVVGCAGCGSQGSAPRGGTGLAAATASGTGSQGGSVTAAASAGPLAAPWPERAILPENNNLLYSNQVLDLAAGMLYVLVSTSQQSQWAPLALEAIGLRTGKVRRGTSYPTAGLALASGFLWVYGTSGPHGHPVLDQVDPRTLGTTRSVRMPAVSGADSVAAVAAGPAGSVWAGVGGALLRISVSTGAVLARAVMPAGLILGNLALGPGGMNLYAGAQRLHPGGGVVLEYSSGAGTLLAQADGGQLIWAASGAWVTAVPGGVWVSFRTGMMGESGLLGARSLAVIRGFVTSRAAATGAGTVYNWTMGAPAAYAGGALWVATDGGVVACVNPATGRVRAEETVPDQQGGVFGLTADGRARRLALVISVQASFTGVVTIDPPGNCWS